MQSPRMPHHGQCTLRKRTWPVRLLALIPVLTHRCETRNRYYAKEVFRVQEGNRGGKWASVTSHIIGLWPFARVRRPSVLCVSVGLKSIEAIHTNNLSWFRLHLFLGIRMDLPHELCSLSPRWPTTAPGANRSCHRYPSQPLRVAFICASSYRSVMLLCLP